MAKQIETQTRDMDKAIKVLEKKLKRKVYRKTLVSGTCVGVQLTNGDEWLLTTRSFYQTSDIVFEKLER